MANKLITFPVLAMVLFLALHVAAAAARDLPKETTLKPKAVEPASAPTSAGEDEKNFIAFGGVGAAAGMGGVVGVIPIGNLGGLGGLPGGIPGGIGGDPGSICGSKGGIAGAVGRKPVVPLVP